MRTFWRPFGSFRVFKFDGERQNSMIQWVGRKKKEHNPISAAHRNGCRGPPNHFLYDSGWFTQQTHGPTAAAKQLSDMKRLEYWLVNHGDSEKWLKYDSNKTTKTTREIFRSFLNWLSTFLHHQTLCFISGHWEFLLEFLGLNLGWHFD